MEADESPGSSPRYKNSCFDFMSQPRRSATSAPRTAACTAPLQQRRRHDRGRAPVRPSPAARGRRRARGVLPRPRRRRLVRRGAAGLPRPEAGDGRDTAHALARAQLAGRQPALQHRRPAVRPLAPRAPPPRPVPRPLQRRRRLQAGRRRARSYTLRRSACRRRPTRLRAVEQAEAGDTLELLPGTLLSRELSIEKPPASTPPPRRAPQSRRRRGPPPPPPLPPPPPPPPPPPRRRPPAPPSRRPSTSSCACATPPCSTG